MKTILIPALALALGASAGTTPDIVWLDLDAARPRDSLLLVKGEKTEVTFGTSVSDSGTHLKFTGTGGFQIPSWRHPTGAWYVAARVRMDVYGDQASWFISDILNSSTWPDGSVPAPAIQGFQFRTGGSGLYPVAPRNPALTDAQWQATLGSFDHAYQAKMSQCLAGISFGTDSESEWIQSNSDRCLPLGRWVHFVASWDGKRQHLFLDGVEVTDTLRQLGQGLVPRMDAGMPLAFGMRGASVNNQFQFFHGGLQSVRIVKGDLDSAKALALYQGDMKPAQGSCQALPVIVNPGVADVAVPADIVKIRLAPSSSCLPGLVPDLELHPGDSLDVLAVSVDGKGTRLASLRTGSLAFPLEKLGIDANGITPFLLKARLVRAPVAARTASVEPSWGMERPMSLAAGGTTRVERTSAAQSIRLLSGSRLEAPGVDRLVVRGTDGRRFVLTNASPDGTWDLSILPRGMWWIGAGNRVVVLPRL